jgi:hypothetical protein
MYSRQDHPRESLNGISEPIVSCSTAGNRREKNGVPFTGLGDLLRTQAHMVEIEEEVLEENE